MKHFARTLFLPLKFSNLSVIQSTHTHTKAWMKNLGFEPNFNVIINFLFGKLYINIFSHANLPVWVICQRKQSSPNVDKISFRMVSHFRNAKSLKFSLLNEKPGISNLLGVHPLFDVATWGHCERYTSNNIETAIQINQINTNMTVTYTIL